MGGDDRWRLRRLAMVSRWRPGWVVAVNDLAETLANCSRLCYNQDMREATAEMPRLTGVTREDGECDRCHRELGKVYEVTHPDGTVATYGRRCCAKVTGYRGDLERAVRMARRTVVVDARKATMTEAGYVLVDPGTFAWFAWEVLTNDRLWDGHDTDGRAPLPFQRWQTWQEALGG